MPRPGFIDIDDPNAPKRLDPPVVVIGPRGEVNELLGPRDSEGFGGDIIGTHREGELSIPKRHRFSHHELDKNGDKVRMGWISYEGLCGDPAIYERHGLSREKSLQFYKRHMGLLRIRDAGNDITETVDFEKFYHPEIIRRRALPKMSGSRISPEQFDAMMGEGAKEAGPSLEDLRAQAKDAGITGAGRMGIEKLQTMLGAQ